MQLSFGKRKSNSEPAITSYWLFVLSLHWLSGKLMKIVLNLSAPGSPKMKSTLHCLISFEYYDKKPVGQAKPYVGELAIVSFAVSLLVYNVSLLFENLICTPHKTADLIPAK